MDELDDSFQSGHELRPLHRKHALHELDGIWSTAWNGGAAGDDWIYGVARVHIVDEHFYAITDDDRADCFIAAEIQDGSKLSGRYLNLANPEELLAWCGLVRSKSKIEGMWPQGRWNLWR